MKKRILSLFLSIVMVVGIISGSALTVMAAGSNDTPFVPWQPEAPDTPTEPPETPDTPTEPETPDTPTETETPDTPTEPETPDTPTESETPDTPTEPETPDTPTEPEIPDTPTEPETPDTPTEPETPYVPTEPNTPDIPSAPVISEDTDGDIMNTDSKPKQEDTDITSPDTDKDIKASAADCTKDNTCPMYTFDDLDMSAWYHDGIHYCIENGLMNGTGTTTFAPDTATSRAMIVTILWRLEGEPVVNYAMTFEDVAADTWYTDAIRWAASEGIVNGYSDTAFGPNDEITREQFATIMYRYEQYKGGGFTGAWMFRMDYADLADVSDWAYEAMCWMNMNGIVNGKPGKVLDPQGSATRAETAAFLHRFCEYRKEQENQ